MNWTVGNKKEKVVRLIHAFEQLDAIEKATGYEKQKLLEEYGKKTPLNWVLSLNFRDDIVLELPEGMPPMDLKDMDDSTHPDMQGLLSASIGRLKYCVNNKEKSHLKKFKKEQIFYEIIATVPIKDAEILCSAKDKSLTEMYPTITRELVGEIFPAYVSNPFIKK